MNAVRDAAVPASRTDFSISSTLFLLFLFDDLFADLSALLQGPVGVRYDLLCLNGPRPT
ncbi:hypothetical protein [Streptomyces purpurascens]|uniref:Uncharacterized protein n=1 Tax=Streptomyces purpurascens TaxID=1924 RepID=A0ABZ1MT34_STREF